MDATDQEALHFITELEEEKDYDSEWREPSLGKADEAASIADQNQKVASVIFKPLSHNQLRLVRIERGSHGKAVRCSLSTVDLAAAPPYQALSYVWGSQSRPLAIQLNGEPFDVTRNLHAALSCLRLADQDRVIWIDALAINQCDVAERSQQVKMMTRIYSFAQETLVWLEREMGPKVDDIWQQLQQGENTISNSSRFIFLDVVMRQPYWSRVWTAQEVMHSRDVTMVTRRGSLPFKVLPHCLACLHQLVQGPVGDKIIANAERKWVRKISLLYSSAQQMLFIQPRSLSKKRVVDFDNWINLCYQRQCSDPRDQVFGFWGCFSPEIRQNVVVDYSLSLEEVLRQTIAAFLAEKPGLNFLCRSNYFDSKPSLPSWTPGYLIHDNCGHQSFMYGYAQTPQGIASTYKLLGGSILLVKGCWAGEVVATTGLFTAIQRPWHHFFWPILDGVADLGVKAHEIDGFVKALFPLMMTGKLDKKKVLWEVTMWRNCLADIVGNPGKVAAMKTGFEDFVRKYGVEDDLRLQALNEHQLSIIRIRMEPRPLDAQPRSIPGTLWKRKSLPVFGTTWKKKSMVGDRVCFIQGWISPLLLRPRQSCPEGRQEYKVVGQFAWAEEDQVKQLLEDIKTGTSGDDVYLC